MGRWLPILYLAAASLAAPSAAADVDIRVNVGWGDRYRPDRWTPAVVSASADQVTPVIFRWYVPRPGRESMIIEQSVTLNQKPGDHLAYLPVGPDPAAIHLVVSHAATGRTLAFWPTDVISPMEYADVQVREPIFIGVSGEGPALYGLDDRQYAVSFLAIDHLPRHTVGYDGLDVLALNRPQILDIEPARQQAIAAWVRGGGRLLIWLDTQAIPTESALLSLIPGGVIDFTTIEIDGSPVPYTRLRGVGEGSLVTRRQVGLGEVIFLHVSPADADRAGAQYLPTEVPKPVEHPKAPISTVAAAAKATDASRLPIALLALAVLVGPVDWLILHRSRRRMRRWVTLPGWLAVFALLIWHLPTQPADEAWIAVEPSADTSPPILRGTLATTGGGLTDEQEADLERLTGVGSVHWRTIGFDRTTGPLRDLPFHQGPDGMILNQSTPLVAEGTAIVP